MASFVAMVPPREGEEGAVLVRDGFAWIAFVVPVLWLLWHRLWVEALAVFALQLALGTLGEVSEARGTATLLGLLVQLAVGLEGPNWHLSRLRRRGWGEAGAVEAQNRDEAETRFFAHAPEPETPLPPARAFGRPVPPGPAPFGLLGYKG